MSVPLPPPPRSPERTRSRSLGFVAVVTVGLAIGGASGIGMASSRSAPHGAASSVGVGGADGAGGARRSASFAELAVPRALTEITIDGELDDLAWNESAARTGAFLSGGEIARPYSDARLAWRDGTLYVALYAADEDIVAPATTHDAPLWTGDSFHLVFRGRDGLERSLDVSPRGVVTDGQRVPGGVFDAHWESRAKVGVDTDGTVDDSSDEDEEWIVEMAIPMKELGMTGVAGERIGLEISRCDRVRGAQGQTRRVCASWGDGRSEIVLR